MHAQVHAHAHMHMPIEKPSNEKNVPTRWVCHLFEYLKVIDQHVCAELDVLVELAAVVLHELLPDSAAAQRNNTSYTCMYMCMCMSHVHMCVYVYA